MYVLFIDDDNARTKSLREGMEVLGNYEIDFAADPMTALDLYRKNSGKYKAVIIDIMMPHYGIAEYTEFRINGFFDSNGDGMYTGLRLIMQIKDIMKENETYIPIIVLTCLRDIEEMLHAINVEVVGIIYKPVMLAPFVARVTEIVGNKNKK